MNVAGVPSAVAGLQTLTNDIVKLAFRPTYYLLDTYFGVYWQCRALTFKAIKSKHQTLIR